MSEGKGLRGKQLKEVLRRSIVPDMNADEIEDLDMTLRLHRIRTIGKWFLILVAAVLIFLVYRGIRGTLEYKNFSVVWENEELGSNDATYQVFGGNILRITMDGVAYLDTSGEVKWNYGYSMKTPQVVIQGSYGIIADIQANNAIVFNSTGVTGSVTTTLPILNATVSSHGVSALVLNDTGVNYITFYDNSGEPLDIKIKTKLAGDGYPMDLSLSPTGTGLATAIVNLEQNQMQNQIVFYNFDVGQGDSDRLVGYYSYGNTMFPEVAYLSDTVVVAFGDDQINFYNLKNEKKPLEVNSVEMEGDVYSVFYDSSRVAVICQTEDTNRLLRVYDTEGKLKFEKAIEFDYTTAAFSNGYIDIYNSTECLILSGSGKVRYRGTLDGNILGLVSTGDSSCLVMNGNSMRKLRFK